jgi:hypothetical protein
MQQKSSFNMTHSSVMFPVPLQLMPAKSAQASENLDAFHEPVTNVPSTGLDCKKSCRNASSFGPIANERLTRATRSVNEGNK